MGVAILFSEGVGMTGMQLREVEHGGLLLVEATVGGTTFLLWCFRGLDYDLS